MPMKIALVSPYDHTYPGGVASHISHLKHHFTKMGHEVKIIAPVSKSRRDCLKEEVIAIGRPVPVPAGAGGSVARITFSPSVPFQVRKILKKENFDIVHLHEPVDVLLPLSVLLQSKSINVGTFHAYHDKPRGYWLGGPILRRWLPRLDGLIAVSKPAMEFASRHLPGEYEIIPNGVDIERFSPDVPLIPEFCDDRLNILFVGRLEKRKGLGTLISAYGKAKKQYPNSRLIVVGPGTKLRHDYEKQIEENGLEDVVFVGYISDEELPRYYRTADVFCSPATGHESFGIILLEAMACGRPVVASNIDGYAGVGTHGSDCLLVPPNNDEALADALVSLLGDTSRRQHMGVQGRLTAEKYSWDHVAQRVLDYYLWLMSKK